MNSVNCRAALARIKGFVISFLDSSTGQWAILLSPQDIYRLLIFTHVFSSNLGVSKGSSGSNGQMV